MAHRGDHRGQMLVYQVRMLYIFLTKFLRDTQEDGVADFYATDY